MSDSDHDSHPTTDGGTKSGQPDHGSRTHNDGGMGQGGNDDDNSDEDFLNGNMLQLLHNQKFNRQADSQTEQADARRLAPRGTSSDGPRPSSCNKRKCSQIVDSDQSEQSSSNSGDDNEEEAATAGPTTKKARCPPRADNRRSIIPPQPQQSSRASPRAAQGKLRSSEELYEEWEKHDGVKHLCEAGQEKAHGLSESLTEGEQCRHPLPLFPTVLELSYTLLPAASPPPPPLRIAVGRQD